MDSDEYYLIEDAADLAWLVKNLSANAKLANDIDLAEYISGNGGSWTPIGTSSPYAGTFDGCGYTISNLTINSSSNSDYVGLFGYVGSGGTVKNLTLKNVSVSGSITGGIVGYNRGAVSNCVVSASVSGGSYIGGVVGLNNGSVSNCGYLSGSANKPIGDGSGTNVGSFTEVEMDQIAVTLFASIENSAIAADGRTTITLKTQPGDAGYVMTAGGLAVTTTGDSSDLVTITKNSDTLTVKGNGQNGTAAITVGLYTYNYAYDEYDTDSAPTNEITFDLTLTGAEETPETPSANNSGSGGGCNAGTGALALLAAIPLALRRKR